MEKIKKFLKEKDKNKKIENLVVFLIILVITLIIINTIIKEDEPKEKKKYSNAELASTSSTKVETDDLEARLENILSKIEGVGEVSVLVSYSQSSEVVPIYNENNNKSVTEETDDSGGKRTIQSEENQKSVVTGSDSNPVTRKNNPSQNRRCYYNSKRCWK